ncbi:glycosyltransferase [Micromonospora sp. C31]|uniref:glycosyltransferase family 2 protein n=1 Tax=Micromonospora sp. C31 TaxID=2824876 RepID=UPI001B379F97|nr:glycosyltransferase [Micromonospora sp. C31]MBQ1071777.1 glycosyltransferase [Micromonospora sp. C31]
MSVPAIRPALSVVMPTYQDPQCLALTLKALTRQTLAPERFEVIVVRDGGSFDGYAAALAEGAGLRLRVLELPGRKGRSAARNAGARRAAAPLLVFLDADSWAVPDLLERHLAWHSTPGNAAVLIGRRDEIGLADLPAVLAGESHTIARAFPHGGDLRFATGLPDDNDWLQAGWVIAYTHNVSLSSALFAQVGGYREAFGLSYGVEDVELFYRVDRSLPDGVNFGYDDEARVVHLPHHKNITRNWMEMKANFQQAAKLYPCLEWELLTAVMGYEAIRRILHYRALIDECVERSACAIGPAVARLAGQVRGPRTLWIGTGRAGSGLPASALTFDYAAPIGPANFHLLGVAPPMPPGSLDAVVSVDFWRYLLWPELCQFISASLALAGEVHLVATADATPGMCAADPQTLDYLRQAQAAEYAAELRAVEGLGDVLTLRARQAATSAARRVPGQVAPRARPPALAPGRSPTPG